MFGLAKFLEAPRYIAPKLAQKIRDYAVNKINAPVCSIISTGTVKLPAMPIIALTDAEQKRINSMAKFSSISDKLFK